MSDEIERLIGSAAQLRQTQDADDSELYWRVVKELHYKRRQEVERCTYRQA